MVGTAEARVHSLESERCQSLITARQVQGHKARSCSDQQLICFITCHCTVGLKGVLTRWSVV